MRKTLLMLAGVAAIACCVALIPSQEAEGQRANDAGDPFFDISYTVEHSAGGGIDVSAIGFTHAGEKAELATDVARIIRGGEITKIYVNHPNEDLITEIEVAGKELEITNLTALAPKKHTHRGHVTVLK